jgi:hypothetical protein
MAKKTTIPAKKPKGAFAVDPKLSLSGQLAQLDARIKAGKATTAERHQRNSLYNQVQTQAAAPAAGPTPQQQQTDQYNGLMMQGGNAQSSQFDQIQEQGDFNPQTMGIQQFNYQQFQPGDFQQQFQGAYDTALNQFNRSSEPAFARQKQDFDQMVAERGIDPTSQQYKEMYKARISDPQETARLNAQDAAYQTGLGAQNQAYQQSANTNSQQYGQASGAYGQNLGAQGQQFGQATTQYQMPYQNLSALSPYLQAQYGNQQAIQQQGFGQQNAAQNQEYAKELAALQQKYTMENQKFAVNNRPPTGGGGGGGGGRGGGGGLTLADQMALQNNQFYNQMVLGGLNGPQSNMPSAGNLALAGASNGLAAGLTSQLAK